MNEEFEKTISYRKGYKYQLQSDYAVEIPIRPSREINSDYVDLSLSRRLTVKKGYAWDGPSGPTVDTSNFMRGSLVHDALYQLMRESHLSPEKHRNPADRLLRRMCREDGMGFLRAWWVYQGVKIFGKTSADPANKKPIIRAPKTWEITENPMG